jgi:signal peptidase
MKKINWKTIGNIFYWVIFVVLLFFAGVVAISALNLPNGIKIFTVQSGSMSPAIRTGSMIISKPIANYQKGDIITVQDPANPKNTFTHRI